MSGPAQEHGAGGVSGEVGWHSRSLAPSRPPRLGRLRKANVAPNTAGARWPYGASYHRRWRAWLR